MLGCSPYLYFCIFQVSEEDIEEMFTFADKDGDGMISYAEFQVMINPPKPPEPPKPTLADLAKKTKMEDKKASTKGKAKEPQPLSVAKAKSPEPIPFPATKVPEPQTLSVANILIHNAKTKDSPLKGTKATKEKGGKKEKDGKENLTVKK